MSEYQGCDKCKNVNKRPHEEPCVNCTHCAEEHFEPMTHADVIRNMTDEELAEFFEHHFSCGYCDVRTDFCGDDDCKELMLEWLQAEAKGDSEC